MITVIFEVTPNEGKREPAYRPLRVMRRGSGGGNQGV